MKKIFCLTMILLVAMSVNAQLNAPTPSSPMNGATLTSISASLQWSTVSGTSRYQWQCDTTEDFDSPLLVQGSTSSYYATASGLHFGQTYYWRVRACTAADTSDWSSVRNFTTPSLITLTSPANGANVTAISPSLEWTSISGTSRYQWQCDTTLEFNSPLFVQGTSSSYYATASGLHFGQTYYWRVRACTAADTSDWSSVRNFTTPSLITLTSPANGANVTAISPSLEWTSISGTSRYQWQCDTTLEFNSPLFVQGASSSYYATASGLHFGQTYYWRVRACTAADTSDWSSVRTFTTPSLITLTSPANGANVTAISPSLEWTSISGTSRYQWQCDTTVEFNSPLFVQGTSSSYYATASGLHFGQTYYWRVRACTAADTSDWSSVRNFTTPSLITLTSPANGANVTAISPSLEWTSISGTSRYQWQCDTTLEFNSSLFVQGTSSSYYATASGLHYGQTYYWRVRACTAADTSDWSSVRTFTTPSRVTLTSPSNGSSLANVATSLQWNSISGSSGYIYQYDALPTFNSNFLITATTTSYYKSINGLNYNTNYYWRVCAYNSVDTSDWSEVRYFTTPSLNMTTPCTLVSPANGSTHIAPDGQLFVWNRYPNAQTYQIEYSTDNSFMNDAVYQQIIDTSLVINNLNVLTTYYWRVRAVNGSDFSPWSLTWSFTTSACAVTNDWSEVVCGNYVWNETTYTESGDYIQYFETESGCDSIVTLHLTVHQSVYMEDAITLCRSDLPYMYGDTLLGEDLPSEAVFTFYYTSFDGCDSIVTLTVHVTEVNTDIHIYDNGAGIYYAVSLQDNAQYQWISCSGMPIQVVDNEQQFEPNVYGSYQVIITMNGCVDTSECVEFGGQVDGISERAGMKVYCYPNPAVDYVVVMAENIHQIRVYSIMGQKIADYEVQGGKSFKVETCHWQSGTYIMHVVTDSGIVVLKLAIVSDL